MMKKKIKIKLKLKRLTDCVQFHLTRNFSLHLNE